MQRKECVTITMRKFRYILLIVMILCSVMTVFARAENGSGFTLEEMEAKFHEAEKEAAVWYSYCSGDMHKIADENLQLTAEQRKTANCTSGPYWQVIGINSIAEIREKLGKYFTPEAVDDLMTEHEYKIFVEVDGKLYWRADTGQYSYDDWGTYDFKITSQNDSRVVLHLDYYEKTYYPDESDDVRLVGEYDYIYEKQEDGTWKFATYKMPMGANSACGSLYLTYKNSKNPQTGDNGITVVIALCAVSAIGVVAFKKRKVRN